MIETVCFDNEAVVILDQSKLPDEVAFRPCHTPEEVAEAICSMKVRGAPLIGVVAAFGLALGMRRFNGSAAELYDYFYSIKEMLASTRPTAVNLFWALQRMEKLYLQHRQEPAHVLGDLLLNEAEKMRQEDIAINQAMGENGQALLSPGARVMTICNAGTLATCGYGTALGVVRSAARRTKIDMVWVCETRPVLQGARLTVWELMQDNIPVTLITDSMAGYTMQLGRVDAIIVGADRIAANGDTANKIGTFPLAVLAHYHQIPFYVAAPLSTVDLSLPDGKAIVIEERHQDEVRRCSHGYVTVPEVEVFNPAFDVTPQHLISAIITEGGIITAPFAEGLKRLKEGR
jgi:methylthioribose-1-phosphate isomerase